MSAASPDRDQDSKISLSFPPVSNGRAFIRAKDPGPGQDCLAGYAERSGSTWTAYLWTDAVPYHPAITQDDHALTGERNPAARVTLDGLRSLRGEKDSLRARALQHIACQGRWWRWPGETGVES